MKTIAIDMRLLGKKRTGDEMVFRCLTRALLSLDSENRYILLTDETDRGKLTTIYHELNLVSKEHVEVVTLIGKNRFVWNLWAIPLFLLKRQVDVFHTQYILPIFVPKRTKVVLHIHDVSFRAMPWLIGFVDRFFLTICIPHALKRADVIIAPSRFTQQEIVRYFAIEATKIAVVPNALGDGYAYVATDDAVLRVRERYALPDRYMIVIGTLQPRKNIPFLIHALAALKKRDPDMKLVLVGNRTAHHFDSDIDHAIAETNLGTEVIFPGFIPAGDLPAVIRGASLCVFPSRYEGFGIPLLEAMSQQVPIAASDIPSFHEIAGDAIVYFDAEPKHAKVDACAEILYTLTIDFELRKRLIEASLLCLKQYSWKRSAQLLAKIYGEEIFSARYTTRSDDRSRPEPKETT